MQQNATKRTSPPIVRHYGKWNPALPFCHQLLMLLLLCLAPFLTGSFLIPVLAQTPPEASADATPPDLASADSPSWDTIYADDLPPPYQPAPGQRNYLIRAQGNTSNCDYLAVYHGIQNIGGDGERAYWRARELIPQGEFDYREGFYTRLGPNGSDQPFGPDNLGAAPEAFVGVYEDLGYNAVSMSATPNATNPDFIATIYRRLTADPTGTFAHLWVSRANPNNRSPRDIVITDTRTGERIVMPGSYHEVVAIASPQPDQVIILDGLVGYPFAQTLDQLANTLGRFNRVIVVSRNNGTLQDHQRTQLQQLGQPFVDHPLGGAYLRTARDVFGPNYQQWGRAITLPFKTFDGTTEGVTLHGEYIQYDRTLSRTVTLSPLGVRMAQDLEKAGILPADAIHYEGLPEVAPNLHTWIKAQFGSLERFHRIFGPAITPAFQISVDQMNTILHHRPHPLVNQASQEGFQTTLTERAMLVWNAQTGAFLIPLGQVYYDKVLSDLNL